MSGYPSLSSDLWSIDLARQSRVRLTNIRGANAGVVPNWTPDGRSVTYAAGTESGSTERALFTITADAAAPAEQLLVRPHPVVATTWSPDGGTVVFGEIDPPTNVQNVWTFTPNSGEEPLPFLASEFNERDAQFSPDGRWIVYVSDVSGQDEVYIRPYPMRSESQIVVSTGGGSEPAWSPTGDELFYRSDTELMAVSVKPGPRIALSPPRALFDDDFPRAGLRNYDVAKDGSRFIMVGREPLRTEDALSNDVMVVQNWHQELLERVPVP